jgi:peptide deformylase
VLNIKASAVKCVDEDVRKLMDDMVETMYAESGVGLAAPQVGVSKRVIVIDPGAREGEESNLMALANPVITSADGEDVAEEGCLSLPEFTTNVPRAEHIVVQAIDREGNECEIEASGLVARILQHEIDHLDGVLLLSKASMLKREFYKKRVKKALAKTG